MLRQEARQLGEEVIIGGLEVVAAELVILLLAHARNAIYKEVEAGGWRGGMPGGGRWWDPRRYYPMAVERQPGSMKPGGDG